MIDFELPFFALLPPILAAPYLFLLNRCYFENGKIIITGYRQNIHREAEMIRQIGWQDLDQISCVRKKSSMILLLQTKGVERYKNQNLLRYAFAHPFRVKVLYLSKKSLLQAEQMPNFNRTIYRDRTNELMQYIKTFNKTAEKTKG